MTRSGLRRHFDMQPATNHELPRSPFLARLRRRARQLGESTKAIRANVLTDYWYFQTAPPPEAKLLRGRWSARAAEFMAMQG